MDDIVVPFGGRNIRVVPENGKIKISITGVIVLYGTTDEAEWFIEQLKHTVKKCQ